MSKLSDKYEVFRIDNSGVSTHSHDAYGIGVMGFSGFRETVNACRHWLNTLGIAKAYLIVHKGVVMRMVKR